MANNNNFYDHILIYSKFLKRYIDGTNFGKTSYKAFNNFKPPTNSESESITSTQSSTTYAFLASHLKYEPSIENFHVHFTTLITDFELLIIDTNPKFYSLTGINVIYQILSAAICNTYLVYTTQSTGSVKFDELQIESLNKTKQKMTDIFKINNIQTSELVTKQTTTNKANNNNNNNNNSQIDSVLQNQNIANNNNNASQNSTMSHDMNSSIEEFTSKLENVQKQLTKLMERVNKQPNTEELLEQMSKLIDSKLNNHASTPRNNINNSIDLTSPSAASTNVQSVASLSQSDLSNLKKQFTKKAKSTDHLNFNTSLLNNNKVSRALTHTNFPLPFLPDDQLFLDRYNNLIKNCRADIYKLIIARMNERIAESENQLIKYKEEFKNVPNFNNILCDIEDTVNKSLTIIQTKNINKLHKILTNTEPHEYQLITRDYQQHNHSPDYSPQNYFRNNKRRYQDSHETSMQDSYNSQHIFKLFRK